MSKEYPHIRIETIDKSKPPTAQNINVYFNDENISYAVSGVEVSISVTELTEVTLYLYANTEIDGLVLKGES